MKLTQKDIRYVMNEARNIVAERRGIVKENAVDSLRAATNAKAGAEMENGKHILNAAKKAAGKVKGAAKKVAQRVRNTAKNAAQMANGSGSKSKKGQRPGQPQTAGNAMRKNTKVPTTSNE